MGVGNYLLPIFNKRFSDWAIEPKFWAILGLGLVFSVVLSLPFFAQTLPTWVTCLMATIYLFLMLQSTTVWWWIPWAAVLGLLITGFSVLSNLFTSEAAIVFGLLLWANILLRASSDYS